MKLVVPPEKFQETIPIITCNPGKLVAIFEGYLGIVEFKREEGISQYRIYWNNGNASQWFNSIALLIDGTPKAKIYQL